MAAAEAVLVAKGLKKAFRKVEAVRGIDLELRRGECLALLGPNGAGKTTTVEMLEGLMAPDAGSVSLFGRILPDGRNEALGRIGVQLQETNLYKRNTVRETLELFASFYRRSVDLDALIARLALSEKADQQLRTLSGGQKQRAYLACALVNDPELLFLDEPTTGLDPQARRAIWDLLAGVKAEGRALLLTTHYMEEAAYLADRVAIVDHGLIIAEGTPRELVRRTFGEAVLWAQLTPDDEVTRARLASMLPWFADAQASDGGHAYAVRDVAEASHALFEAARGCGAKVAALKTREGTLEDVFLRLTGRGLRDG